MSAIGPVAAITFREGIKNRVLFGIFLIALLLFAATTVVVTVFMRDVVKVAVDFSLSTVSFAGLLTLFFIGVNLFGKDIDKRTIYMVISRPVSRAQYLVGKFFGLVLLALAVTAFLGLLSAAPIVLAKRFYFYAEAQFSWGTYGLAVAFIFVELSVVAAVITLFSAFTSNSFITLILALAAYLIGQSTEAVRALLTTGPEEVKAGPLLSAAVDAAYYLFPNLALFDLKLQAAHGLTVSPSYLLWTAAYALCYLTVTVAVGTLAFRRREFP
jgi:ABC-type transport system involved in multi-copper enzyme maturation permease subunit